MFTTEIENCFILPFTKNELQVIATGNISKEALIALGFSHNGLGFVRNVTNIELEKISEMKQKLAQTKNGKGFFSENGDFISEKLFDSDEYFDNNKSAKFIIEYHGSPTYWNIQKRF